jgi:hypothetical protein
VRAAGLSGPPALAAGTGTPGTQRPLSRPSIGDLGRARHSGSWSRTRTRQSQFLLKLLLPRGGIRRIWRQWTYRLKTRRPVCSEEMAEFLLEISGKQSELEVLVEQQTEALQRLNRQAELARQREEEAQEQLRQEKLRLASESRALEVRLSPLPLRHPSLPSRVSMSSRSVTD